MADGRARGRAKTKADSQKAEVVGPSARRGVRIESKTEGGSAQTQLEVGTPNDATRDLRGRRVFDSREND